MCSLCKCIAALAKQLADVLDFVLRFDDAKVRNCVSLNKLRFIVVIRNLLRMFDDAATLLVPLQMVNPAIQNDFSYYRRTLNRMKINKKDANIKVRPAKLRSRLSMPVCSIDHERF